MKEKDVITLTDQTKYIVLKIAKIKNKEFLYLLKVGEDADFVLVENNNGELTTVEDMEEKISLLEIMGMEAIDKK